MLMKLIELIFKFGPLVFGIGFMWPLITQVIERAEITLPFGLTPLVVGAVFGIGSGLIAQLRGSWIWLK